MPRLSRRALCGGALALPALPALAARNDLSRAADTLAGSWQGRWRQEGLRHVVAAPFVVAGDGTAEQLQRYRDGTLLAAARALRATYFRTAPKKPILILLFETEAPYRRLAKKWFNDDDVSPFGYFRRDGPVMLMNVGTGTGTLVHEITHALVEPDFPDIPDWVNEGLGSLYEQCTLDGDRITGLPNWRLPPLQRAIRSQNVRSLKAMIEDAYFYREERVGMNYAQARYLMLYLQEKRLLVPFYKALRDNAKADLTGLATLQKLIAPQTQDELEKEWRQWTLGVRFAG
jgi:hypothetical protein